MNSDYYRRLTQRHQEALAKLQREKAGAAAANAEAARRASEAKQAAGRSTSTSTIQSRLREAQRYEETAAKQQKKVAELETKVATEHQKLAAAQRSLADEDAREQRRRLQQEERAVRENQRALSSIHSQLSAHSEMHRLALSTLDKLGHPRDSMTVLFLAANPVDQKQLRLDEEVRAIGEMIRKAQHRDSVKLESRWAVRPLDVLQAINECQPRIVHFSGHGSEADEIVFLDSAGNAKLVSKEAIVQTMAAGSDDIQLVFFNTCYSRGQAQALVEHIPAAIGMNQSIGDVAARIFAAQFYSAIGFGLSIGRAFSQAKSALMLEGIGEEDTPELFVALGLDADSMMLIRRSD